MSIKNNQYWSNAEEVRLAKKKKALEDHKEKMVYDPKFREGQDLKQARLAGG